MTPVPYSGPVHDILSGTPTTILNPVVAQSVIGSLFVWAMMLTPIVLISGLLWLKREVRESRRKYGW